MAHEPPSGAAGRATTSVPPIAKAASGIAGLDELTHGGLPRGRATLVSGGAGTGKTLFGLQFLVRGALDHDETGVLLAFEERREELCANVASLGWDLPDLERQGRLVVDTLELDPAEIVETGDFDLQGIFIRLGAAIDAVGARRVVLDTVEVLFTALGNQSVVRAELNRLLHWLKDRGMTTVITGERGPEGQLTRFGIEEYVSDCVVILDHRVSEELSTRRLRVVKYRGSVHGTNEYPFVITDRGLVVMPITSLELDYEVSEERVTTGIPRLDHMLGGGVFRGSTILVSGMAGTGKTTIAAGMADAACAAGERVVFVSLEEARGQIVRNMHSVGLDLERWTDTGLLDIWPLRATVSGLEEHLTSFHHRIEESAPALVVIDSAGSLLHVGSRAATTSAVMRFIDLLKSRGVTAVLTALTHDGSVETTSVDISSLVDTWLLLRNVESNGERNRLVFVLKSRGSAHSNQVREFVLTDHGPELLDVWSGPEGVLTGSARLARQQHARAEVQARDAELARRQRRLERHSREVAQRIATLEAELADERAEVECAVLAHAEDQAADQAAQGAIAAHRWADEPQPGAEAT